MCLHQPQLKGAYYPFGAPLHLEFIENPLIMPFYRTQGEEKPLANLMIRETLSDQLEHFFLALASWLDQGSGG